MVLGINTTLLSYSILHSYSINSIWDIFLSKRGKVPNKSKQKESYDSQEHSEEHSNKGDKARCQTIIGWCLHSHDKKLTLALG